MNNGPFCTSAGNSLIGPISIVLAPPKWEVCWFDYYVGWCRQREKMDWQEARKFDCWLVRTIFIFLLYLVNFHKTVARKSNFDS